MKCESIGQVTQVAHGAYSNRGVTAGHSQKKKSCDSLCHESQDWISGCRSLYLHPLIKNAMSYCPLEVSRTATHNLRRTGTEPILMSAATRAVMAVLV